MCGAGQESETDVSSGRVSCSLAVATAAGRESIFGDRPVEQKKNVIKHSEEERILKKATLFPFSPSHCRAAPAAEITPPPARTRLVIETWLSEV